jgi:uncharacterized small protein (DUF1192 family)
VAPEPAAPAAAVRRDDAGLAERVRVLEEQVARLQAELARLSPPRGG